jgi:hypothetical protein
VEAPQSKGAAQRWQAAALALGIFIAAWVGMQRLAKEGHLPGNLPACVANAKMYAQ